MSNDPAESPILSMDLDIPDGWTARRLASFADTATGGTPSREMASFFGSDCPWVKSGELGDQTITRTEEGISNLGLQNSNAKVFPAGTLLMALYGATTGKVGLLGIQAATNQAVCAIFPDAKVARSDFLFYLLMHERPSLLQSRYGGAQPNISQTIVRNLVLPVPPLSEQRAIAHVLRTVQQAKEATEKVIAATRQLKASMMRHLFTYGPVPVADADQVETRESELGLIPRDWNTGRLRDLATKITKGSSPKWQGYDYCVAGTTFVRSQNIGWGRLDLSEVAHLPESFNESHNGSVVKSKDVLVNLVGAEHWSRSYGRRTHRGRESESGGRNREAQGRARTSILGVFSFERKWPTSD